MIWIRKTGMTLNSTMTLHGISTIDDALRFIFSFARAILIFFKTHDLYAFCVERPTTNDFFLGTPLRGARVFYTLFLSRRSDGERLFIQTSYLRCGTPLSWIFCSDENLDKTTFLERPQWAFIYLIEQLIICTTYTHVQLCLELTAMLI